MRRSVGRKIVSAPVARVDHGQGYGLQQLETVELLFTVLLLAYDRILQPFEHGRAGLAEKLVKRRPVSAAFGELADLVLGSAACGSLRGHAVAAADVDDLGGAFVAG